MQSHNRSILYVVTQQVYASCSYARGLFTADDSMRHAAFPQVMQQLYSSCPTLVMQQLNPSCNSYTRHAIAILNSYSRHATVVRVMQQLYASCNKYTHHATFPHVIQQLYASRNSYTRHTTNIRVMQQCRTRFTLCVLTVNVSMASQQKEMGTRWSPTLLYSCRSPALVTDTTLQLS